jgi:hypothetical protein
MFFPEARFFRYSSFYGRPTSFVKSNRGNFAKRLFYRSALRNCSNRSRNFSRRQIPDTSRFNFMLPMAQETTIQIFKLATRTCSGYHSSFIEIPLCKEQPHYPIKIMMNSNETCLENTAGHHNAGRKPAFPELELLRDGPAASLSPRSQFRYAEGRLYQKMA